MKQWMKWMCMGMLAMTMACGDEVDDDTKVSELDEQQVTDLCSEICDDATAWELKCGEGNAEITYSGKNKGECNSTCVSVKSVKDSCGVTAGELRTALSKPSSCSEAESSIAISLKLAACF